jgi:hypothetical protein
VLPSGQKLTSGLLTTIAIEVVPFRAYAPFPKLLPFFKCILEIMFWDSALVTSIVSKWRLSVLSSIGKTEKSRVGYFC